MRKLFTLPYTFVLLNWAALVALYYYLTNKQDIWVKSAARSRAQGERI